MAGAGRPPAGTGGGARELERGGGCVTPRLGPPGDGGDNLGFSPDASQSFFTGGGTGVDTVAMETSPMIRRASLHA